MELSNIKSPKTQANDNVFIKRTYFQTKWMPKVGTGMEKSAEVQQVRGRAGLRWYHTKFDLLV